MKIILGCIKVEPCSIGLAQVKHEDAVNKHKVAVRLSLAVTTCVAGVLVQVESH